MKVIPTSVHGILDYIVGLTLIAAPWLFDFARGGAETWVPVALGVSAIVYSLCTDYERGVVKALSMPAHLKLDLASGLLLTLSPWIFGFSDYVWAPHVAFGLMELGVTLMSRSTPYETAS
ncbi:MAG TPA: hypothetical protein VEC36_12365 [Patescibacteria group bacterium]|nr:hypothetical protein [Patescibacteria group bacterium]